MNTKEALEKLYGGEKVKTMFDDTDIFYQTFEHDTIARMIIKSHCSAEVISRFTPEEFLIAHEGITMVEVET